jgi:hypothetical protein
MFTRRLDFRLFLVSTLAIGGAGVLAQARQATDTVPGPFQAFMATGPRAGMFHAPVCEYDLNPAVLIFVRDGVDFDKPLIDLLKKLDALIAKHPQANVGASVILVGDGGYRKALETALEDKKVTDLTLTAATLAKEAKEAKLKDVVKKENLQHVTLGFADPSGLANYALDQAVHAPAAGRGEERIPKRGTRRERRREAHRTGRVNG